MSKGSVLGDEQLKKLHPLSPDMRGQCNSGPGYAEYPVLPDKLMMERQEPLGATRWLQADNLPHPDISKGMSISDRVGGYVWLSWSFPSEENVP